MSFTEEGKKKKNHHRISLFLLSISFIICSCHLPCKTTPAPPSNTIGLQHHLLRVNLHFHKQPSHIYHQSYLHHLHPSNSVPILNPSSPSTNQGSFLLAFPHHSNPSSTINHPFPSHPSSSSHHVLHLQSQKATFVNHLQHHCPPPNQTKPPAPPPATISNPSAMNRSLKHKATYPQPPSQNKHHFQPPSNTKPEHHLPFSANSPHPLPNSSSTSIHDPSPPFPFTPISSAIAAIISNLIPIF